MQTFIFHNEAGKEIDRINVAGRAEAELYRYEHGYIGSPQPVIEPETGPLAPGQKITPADAAESLRESFRSIGLSDSVAETAARGREGPAWRRARPPATEPSHNPADELREVSAGNVSQILDIRETTPLEQAFRALGLSESAARIAARGRTER
jgi:hypothetical protein